MIDGVDIHRDRHARLPGDSRGMLHGGGVVPVNVQEARAGDLIGRDFPGIDAQAFRPPPQNCALACGAVDDDIRRLVGATLSLLHVVQIDIRSPQALHLDPAAFIVSEGPDVLGPQSQFAASHHSAGHLTAGTQHFVLKRNLARVCRKVRHH